LVTILETKYNSNFLLLVVHNIEVSFILGLCGKATTLAACNMLGCQFADGVCSRSKPDSPVEPPKGDDGESPKILSMEDPPVLPFSVWISGLTDHYTFGQLGQDLVSILCNGISKFC
jgi:hypothetical protein